MFDIVAPTSLEAYAGERHVTLKATDARGASALCRQATGEAE